MHHRGRCAGGLPARTCSCSTTRSSSAWCCAGTCRPAPRSPADDLSPWLAGVTIVNDLSARDIQLPQGQFYKGKSYRGFGPVGPGLVLLTPQEWARWPELHMRLTVNGQTRQDAYCREMIHGRLRR